MITLSSDGPTSHRVEHGVGHVLTGRDDLVQALHRSACYRVAEDRDATKAGQGRQAQRPGCAQCDLGMPFRQLADQVALEQPWLHQQECGVAVA
jgi:hypothetical protein